MDDDVLYTVDLDEQVAHLCAHHHQNHPDLPMPASGTLWMESPCHPQSAFLVGYQPATGRLLLACAHCGYALSRIAVMERPYG